MVKILLVEDDATLAMGMEYTLKNEGFDVTVASTLKEARESIENYNIDLVLLDLMLPDGSGYELCRELRKKSNTPIIFLTASDEEANVVMGLDMGGDDYISKPVRIGELISRIKAVLRRYEKNSSYRSNKLHSGDITIELLSNRVMKNDVEIILTSLEYKLLISLIQNPKVVLSRSQILEKIWDVGGEFVDDNTLSVYVRRLREKIEDDPAKPEYIITMRAVGYKWNKETRE
ncbi:MULTISPECIES: response regulator transcription factor [unclassified Clostridium]|uniref:response regulator transcription factor n=1 Tax=unclassified Clostridium TaxID=2614128 RepID=UPI0025BF0A3F|nr:MULTISPECIES: response regulator transcription factor [unclassified Clostridium]